MEEVDLLQHFVSHTCCGPTRSLSLRLNMIVRSRKRTLTLVIGIEVAALRVQPILPMEPKMEIAMAPLHVIRTPAARNDDYSPGIFS